MSLSDEQFEFAKDVTRLFEFLIMSGVKWTMGEVLRTPEQQQIYYDANLSSTMNSKHLEKKAIDLNFWIDGELTYKYEDLRFIGDFWTSLNELNVWGGNWSKPHDTPHFQRT